MQDQRMREFQTQSKIVDRTRLLPLRARARAEARIVVWTNGCFDLLHIGHLRALQMARSLGDLLIVGVNSDDSVRRLKGAGRPILPDCQRAELLSGLACVDYVTIFDETTPEAAVTCLRPDIHCKGADYAPTSGKPIPEAEIVEAYGGCIKFLPLIPGVSTSEIAYRIQWIDANDTKRADAIAMVRGR